MSCKILPPPVLVLVNVILIKKNLLIIIVTILFSTYKILSMNIYIFNWLCLW